MSRQCSDLCNYRSFSFCTPLKPYATTRRPFFPFQHKLVSIGRSSRRNSSNLLLTPAAQSSSDTVLIATTEHRDGSLVFQFGDASQVVENVDAEEEIDNQIEQESSVVKVLDGDQDRLVEGRLIEVTDGIRNVDIDSDIVESETNGIRDLRESYAESSENLSDSSEKEVLLSEFDAKMNDSLKVVESTLDETTFNVQLDKEESSDPAIYLLDDSPNIDKSEDPEGTLLKGSDDKTVDPSVSVELESAQVSQIEVIDDLGKVETEDTRKSDTEDASVELESTQGLQIEVVDDLEKVETEDTRKSETEDIEPSALPVVMHVSDIESTDAANEDVEEELKDMIVNDGTLIDELPPSNPLDVQLTDAVNEDEEELQEMNINEATIIDEMPSSDQLVVEQPTLDELEQLSTKNREGNDVAFVMPVTRIEEVGTVLEEEASQPESTSLELKPTVQVLDTDLQDTMGQNLDNGTLQVNNEIKDPSVEAIQVSDNEVMDITQSHAKDESQMVESKDTSECDTEDLLPPGAMHVSDVDANERLQDNNISEGTFIDEMPTSDTLGTESSLELSTTKDMGVKDAVADEKLQDMNISEGIFTDEMPASVPLGADSTLEVSTAKYMVVKDVDTNERLQNLNISEDTLIGEMPTSDLLGSELTLDVSTTEDTDVEDFDTSERLQDVNVSEGTFVDEMPTSNALGSEPTLEVSTTKDVDIKDVDMDERLQDLKFSEGTFIDGMPTSDKLGAEPSLEVSINEDMDVKDAVSDERLQDMNISEGTLIDERPKSDPLRAESPSEVSTTKDMDVKDVDMDERLQYMKVTEGSFIDDMPTSDPLGAEPTLEASTTKDMVVKDVDTDERLQDSSTFADEMPTSDLLEAEPTLEDSTTKGTDVKDVNLDESLQNMNTLEDTLIDEKPTFDLLGAEPTLEASITKEMDVKDADMDESLRDINISDGTSISEMPTSDPAEPTLEVSATEDMDVKNVEMDERLQDMNISEGTLINEMPTSDSLGVEPTLEVSNPEALDLKDLAVEAELQLVSNDNMDDNSNADLMPSKPVVKEEVSQPHLPPAELKVTMDVSDIKVLDATDQNLDDEMLQVISEHAGDSYIEDVEESSHQLESQPVQDVGLKQRAHDPLLEAETTEGVVGSSERAEASEVTPLLLASEAEVEREEIYITDDFLSSGVALLEHPFKALTGGDDAYFVAGGKWLGLANGVSQWSLEGTGPGVYAQELMRTCEEIVLDTSNGSLTNPVELLCRGVKETTMSGSSNVLIANFNGQALHVANIGDTGFLIIRHGAVYKKSSPLLHEFHFALQVDDSDDPLQLVKEYLIELEAGDIVISATDGLFDNLYDREITMIVSKSLQAGMKLQEIANILATRAQEVGKSAFVRSPFSDAAQAAGYTGYAGGKPDNVAVIVSLVESRSNLLAL
ncbi:uncharacterized protein LOC143537922 isoform X2 [Bidens hawaiensis]|uniref:uncharacterized protein LOC143537922 isoform X2 n=1 Tax=Bidens hawaiensis TaxID=980011 RepID=UPI00404B0ACF